MNDQVIQFLDRNRVGCLTTLQTDGSPHAAAMHYSLARDPFEIYLQTEGTSKKMQAISMDGTGRASIVVGFSEDDWATFQADGTIAVVGDKAELEKIYPIHYAKNPQAEQYKDLPATVFLKFTPSWWRYTEFKPKFKVISSDD